MGPKTRVNVENKAPRSKKQNSSKVSNDETSSEEERSAKSSGGVSKKKNTSARTSSSTSKKNQKISQTIPNSAQRRLILSESESESPERKENSSKKEVKTKKGKQPERMDVEDISIKKEDDTSDSDEIRYGKSTIEEQSKIAEKKQLSKSKQQNREQPTKMKKAPTKTKTKKATDKLQSNNSDGEEDREDEVNTQLTKKGRGQKKGVESKKTKSKKQESDSEDDQNNQDENYMSEENEEEKPQTNFPKRQNKKVDSKSNELLDSNLSVIDVQKEQGKGELEEYYQLPIFLMKGNIRDKQNRSIKDPKYDGSTVLIPPEELRKETPLFRFGRNFNCYYNDAILLKRLFDCPISMWGKRPTVSVFDNSFKLYVKELLEIYDKSCVVVDQVQFSDDKLTEQDLIKREITQIITKGTYTDYLESNEDYNARYLMCVVESGVDHSFGITLVDCTTHQIYVDDIKNDPAGNQIRTILQKMKPVEIHSVYNNMSDQTKNICKTTCKPQFTFDKSFEFSDMQAIFEEIKKEYRQKIPISKPSSKSRGQVPPAARMVIEEKNSQKMKESNKSFAKLVGNEDSKKQPLIDSEDDTDSEDEVINNDGEVEEEVERFSYGPLSQDYPSLLQDIEDLYESDKKKFEEKHKKEEEKNKKQNNVEEEDNDEPYFDVEFQYYMMLQSLMLTLSYLRSLKLADNVFRMGQFNLLDSNVQKSTSLHLDGHAIENLDIFEVNHQSKITTEGSLLNFIDYTQTPFGRRMLRRWLAYPLKSIEQIEQRQESIEDLMDIEPIVREFDKNLSRLGDIERQISKIFNSSQKSRLKPTSFENFSNSRLKDAFKLAKDLKVLEDILPIFSDHKEKQFLWRILQQ